MWDELGSLPSGPAGLHQAARVIKAHSDSYTSVFLYALEGDTLVLCAFAGRPTEQTRIAVGDGVCGRAVATGRAQVISDVAADADYISCSLETRSECVVLARAGDQIVGQIDIDSDFPDAFTDTDVRDLENAAGRIAAHF